MDVTDIEAGADFVQVLKGAVGSCDVLLAVIGRKWVTCTDHAGRRRLDDIHDFIRIEIGTALARDVRVIPVLVDGANLPTAADLPGDLEMLTRRQAVELRDARWAADIESLYATLDRVLTPPAPVPVPSPVVPQKRWQSYVVPLGAAALAGVSLVLLAMLLIQRRSVEVPAPTGPRTAADPAPPPATTAVAPLVVDSAAPSSPAPRPSPAPSRQPSAAPPSAAGSEAHRAEDPTPRRARAERTPVTGPPAPVDTSSPPTVTSSPPTVTSSAETPESRPVSPAEKPAASKPAPSPPATTAKAVLIVRVFKLKENTGWPYDLTQLQSQTVAQLRSTDDISERFDIADALGAKTGVYVLEGEVLSWQAGSKAKRLMTGLGMGRESAEIRFWIVDPNGVRVLERRDTIRADYTNVAGANTLAHPFVQKITERLLDANLTVR
jgi:hypothetical protein